VLAELALASDRSYMLDDPDKPSTIELSPLNAGPLPIIVGGALTVLCMLVIGVVSATLKSILVAALYEYAASGRVPDQFDGDLLKAAFRPK